MIRPEKQLTFREDFPTHTPPLRREKKEVKFDWPTEDEDEKEIIQSEKLPQISPRPQHRRQKRKTSIQEQDRLQAIPSRRPQLTRNTAFLGPNTPTLYLCLQSPKPTRELKLIAIEGKKINISPKTTLAADARSKYRMRKMSLSTKANHSPPLESRTRRLSMADLPAIKCFSSLAQ